VRRLALAAAFPCLSAPPAPGQCYYLPTAKKLPPGVQLVISTKKLATRISEPLRVHVELFNRSNAPISIVDRLMPERDLELHLFSTRGAEAPLTEFAWKLRFGPLHTSLIGVVLAPGEKYTADEDLATIYAVSAPGKYVLDACRDLAGIGNLYSNKLVIAFAP